MDEEAYKQTRMEKYLPENIYRKVEEVFIEIHSLISQFRPECFMWMFTTCVLLKKVNLHTHTRMHISVTGHTEERHVHLGILGHTKVNEDGFHPYYCTHLLSPA